MPTAGERRDTARYRNAMTGLAAGDAWGYQVEFVSYQDMPSHPMTPPAGEWVISDDTQMTLAVHHALLDCTDQLADIDIVTAALIGRYLEWAHDPDNNRAPGNTCMTSMRHLERGARWHDKDGAVASAGCGAVMRLTPAAFAPAPHWAGLTALQALITHNHPRAVVPALLLATAIRDAPARRGNFLDHALADATAITDGRSQLLGDPFLADVLHPITGDVPSYLVRGLADGTVELLTAARGMLDIHRGRPGRQLGDLCTGVGQGWESASAVALGLLTADLATATVGPARLTARAALAWAATTNGDSDSIACIAGALIGAAQPDAGYWARKGVRPRFEPQYAGQLAAALPPHR